MEGLTSMIYHEKQQQGSMLCAQHALNSLLQGNYFTAPDLSSIALHLDALEETYDDDNIGTTSTNMDDTGFFSVQVLENALKVWGLNLVRWRSEEMRPYHDHPHTQLAFILNLEQHWFTLRRFGPALPNIDHDPGVGHWFNLNSFLLSPEWVGRLYLGMVLQQAEAEGYSVFAVVQADPTAQLALPRTDADEIAPTLPEPTSAPRANSNSQMFARTVDRGSSTHHPTDLGDIEDDDYELQAALQASLMTNSTDHASFDPPPLARAPIPLPESRSPSHSGSSPDSGFHTPQVAAPVYEEDVDPVAASMERNRILLQRMKEEQEYAQRELWADTALSSGETAGSEERRQRRLRQEEEEQTELRRAIEESEELTKRNQLSRDGDNSEDHVMGDGELHAPGPSSHIFGGNRVYDDDDAELQAALKASLESAPPGWQHLEPNLSPSRPASLPSADQAPAASKDVEDVQSISSDSTADQHPSVPETAEPLSVDEIRRKRLAKFGV